MTAKLKRICSMFLGEVSYRRLTIDDTQTFYACHDLYDVLRKEYAKYESITAIEVTNNMALLIAAHQSPSNVTVSVKCVGIITCSDIRDLALIVYCFQSEIKDTCRSEIEKLGVENTVESAIAFALNNMGILQHVQSTWDCFQKFTDDLNVILGNKLHFKFRFDAGSYEVKMIYGQMQCVLFSILEFCPEHYSIKIDDMFSSENVSIDCDIAIVIAQCWSKIVGKIIGFIRNPCSCIHQHSGLKPKPQVLFCGHCNEPQCCQPVQCCRR